MESIRPQQGPVQPINTSATQNAESKKAPKTNSIIDFSDNVDVVTYKDGKTMEETKAGLKERQETVHETAENLKENRTKPQHGV